MCFRWNFTRKQTNRRVTLYGQFSFPEKKNFKGNPKTLKEQLRKRRERNETKQPRNDKIKTKIGYGQYFEECVCDWVWRCECAYIKRAVQCNIEMIWKGKKERKREREKEQTTIQAYQKGLTIFMTRIAIYYSTWFVRSICHALLAMLSYTLFLLFIQTM